MDIETRHRLQDAVHLARRGKRRGERQIQRIQEQCAEAPRDLMRVGDAWLRCDAVARAIDCFSQAAHLYLAQDYDKHACAMLRMVLDLDPDHAEARRLLAESLTAQGYEDAAREVQERRGRELRHEANRNGRRWLMPSAPHTRAIWELRKLRKAA
jgi:hypothetical protein